MVNHYDTIMTKLAKAMLLCAAAIVSFTAQQARGTAVPDVFDNRDHSFAQFLNQASETGPDGNNRFLWDYFSSTSPFAYGGSVLWILNPTGNVVAVGNVSIPASVGAGGPAFLASRHIALHVFPDNNTTLAFILLDSTQTFVQAFSTWTFNAQGILIAAAGPFSFSGLGLQNLEFQGKFLVARWLPSSQLTGIGGPVAHFGDGPITVWVLDEFGKVVSAAGPFGPFTNALVGQVTLPPTSSGPPNQLWHWVTAGPGPLRTFGVNTWTINPSGVVIAATSFGPF